MAGFGMALGGFGEAYPKYLEQQQNIDQNKLRTALMNLQQQAAQRQAQQEQQKQAAFATALPQFAKMQGTGPGGIVTPQQIAGISGGNPDAFTALINSVKPAMSGEYGLARTQLQGQNALDRTQLQGQNALDRTKLTGENALKRVETQQAGANARAEQAASVREEVAKIQQQGMNQRAANRLKEIKAKAPERVTLSPEWKAAEEAYKAAKADEHVIENKADTLTKAFADPQWMAARQAADKALGAMNALATKKPSAAGAGNEVQGSGNQASNAPAAPISHPVPPEGKDLPDGTEVPDETGTIWIKKGDVLVPKG